VKPLLQELDRAIERGWANGGHLAAIRDLALEAANEPEGHAPQAPPAAVPAGYVSMPVERVQHVIDLLAERAHLNNARSPAHNARLLLEATLTAAARKGES
jgi:hypothetical protein